MIAPPLAWKVDHLQWWLLLFQAFELISRKQFSDLSDRSFEKAQSATSLARDAMVCMFAPSTPEPIRNHPNPGRQSLARSSQITMLTMACIRRLSFVPRLHGRLDQSSRTVLRTSALMHEHLSGVRLRAWRPFVRMRTKRYTELAPPSSDLCGTGRKPMHW